MIELALHQRRHQVHDGDAAALHLQPTRRFEAKQASADDHGLGALARVTQERPRIVERAEREDAPLVESLDRRHPRRAAGGQQQRIVRRYTPIVSGDRPGGRVDIDDADAHPQLDVVPAIPVERVDDDVVGALLTREHRRQHHAVVVGVCLVAKHREAEHRVVLENLLDAGHPGHAVSHDNEALHRAPRIPGLGIRDSGSRDSGFGTRLVVSRQQRDGGASPKTCDRQPVSQPRDSASQRIPNPESRVPTRFNVYG